MFSEHPQDLTKQIKIWLTSCINLAEAFSLPDVLKQLHSLETRLNLPGFRLAFVGEFSRGKSTLINRLLEREFLPVGAPPTTATLTSIVLGTEESMEVCFEEKQPEKRPLAEDSWQDLLALDTKHQSQEVFAQVNITLDHPWLKLLDCEFIDTPGAGDLTAQRTEIISNFLGQCDGIVLVISATSPFSITEKVFLEQEIVGRHIPRILVVVSMLDRVRAKERASVMEYITNNVKQISAAIPVFPLHPVDNTTTETQILETVRTQIQEIVASENHREWRSAWRSQQIAGQLLDNLSHLIDIGETSIEASQMTPEERELAQKKVTTQIKEAESRWDEIRLQLEQLRLQHAQKVRQNLLDAKTNLQQKLSLELSQAKDPKIWWEQQLPISLRQEFTTLARKSEGFLMKSLGEDFNWVKRTVDQAFEVKIKWKPTITGTQPKMDDYTLSPLEDNPDLEQYRFIGRIGSGAAMVCSYIVFASVPVAIAVSLGAAGALAYSEQLIDRKLKEQQQSISKELESILNKVINEYCDRLSERLRLLYSQLVDGTKREQILWHDTFQKSINADNKDPKIEVWQQLIDQASALKQEINNTLSY